MSLIVTIAASFFTLVHAGQFRVEVKVAYTTRRRRSLSGAGKEIWDIVDLEIAYKNKRRVTGWLPLRWDAIDEIVTSFKHLDAVSLSFKRYLEGSREYADAALAIMPRLNRGGKLRIVWRERASA